MGSDDSADWKPALAYPPFKKALLEAATAPSPAASPEVSKPGGLPPMPALAPFPALTPMTALPPMPALAPMPALTPMTTALPVPAPFPLPPPAAPAAAAPSPAPAPAPAPAAKTVPCPKCAHANLEEARFCNSCGARMDSSLEEVSSPVPEPAPAADIFSSSAALPPAETAPVPAAEAPEKDPFAHLDPMRSFPTGSEPAPLPESPRRPLQPGKMGQLAAFEEPEPVAPSPAPAAETAPAAVAVPIWKRPGVLAAFAGTAVIAAGLAFVMLNKTAPAPAVAELAPSGPPPMPESPAPAPVEATKTAQTLYTTPPATSSLPKAGSAPRPPKMKVKAPKLNGPLFTSPSIAASKPKRAKKPRPVRAPEPKPDLQAPEGQGGGDTIIESRAPEPEQKPKAAAKPKAKGKRAAKAAAQAAQDDKDPLLEALLGDATQPTTEPGAEAAAEPAAKTPPAIGQRAAAKPSQFSLPGLERPVSASDRAPAPRAKATRPAVDETAPSPATGSDVAPLAEPGKPAPPPGIEDEPVKSAEGDQLALVQVHEQFDFCAQLLAQGAFGDHYDTCLCKDTREAAPYRGRRGFYVTAKKKEAAAGHLETTAKILSSKIDGGVAKVSAQWKSGAGDRGRSVTQSWKLEDGLWCQAP